MYPRTKSTTCSQTHTQHAEHNFNTHIQSTSIFPHSTTSSSLEETRVRQMVPYSPPFLMGTQGHDEERTIKPSPTLYGTNHKVYTEWFQLPSAPGPRIPGLPLTLHIKSLAPSVNPAQPTRTDPTPGYPILPPNSVTPIHALNNRSPLSPIPRHNFTLRQCHISRI